MWQYTLWGLAGAAASTGVAFLDNSKRVKGLPWPRSNGGPGGYLYLSWVMVHMVIAGLVTAVLATASVITNPVIAFGAGTCAPLLVEKFSAAAKSLIGGSLAGDGGGDLKELGGEESLPDEGGGRNG